MAILENIRKRTTILILIIGMALFAFVISGVFTSSDFGSTGKVGSTVAEINGEEISVDAFRQKIEFASQNSANTSSLQLVNQVYDQEVRNTILGQQFEDLGIDIEQDQIMNYIKTIPGYAQSPQFQDESGIFDENKFRDFIEDMKATREDGRYARWLQTEKSIIQSAKEQAYFNLVKAGVGATLKEGELDYKLANNKVDLKYVRVPYSSIPDSTITVTKSEIAAYINAHKDEYKQEEARDLQFVYFEEKASAADETAIENGLLKLMDDSPELNTSTNLVDTIPGFRNTTDVGVFVDRNSDIKFDTIFKAKNALPASFADTLMTLNVGETFGPYRDGNFFKISKMIARKTNGSVKASHILVTYEGAERANPEIKRTKEEAEARAKQLLRDARKPGAVFVELARDNSDGPSAPNGGDLGFFQEGVMTPKFNDYAFGNKVGSIGLVETDFGFHIVRVDDKEDIVQIAHLAREIEASEETINNLFTEATKFEMATVSGDKVFTDLAKESEYLIRPVNKINALDENLPGLTNQRNIVQWAFNEDTEIGDIKRFNINNGYAVVQLTKAYKEGVMSVEDASASILPKIRKERKAAQIIGQHQGKSMEDLAKDANVSMSNATALTVKSPTIPGAGREAAIVGAAYAMNEGETSGLIEGETGVFMVMVTKKEEAAALDNYSTYANTLKNSNAGRVNTAVFDALKEASEIEDNRAVFY
ncbi:peptidylprolyl isomerase [Maribacter algarum]|uniref:Periplasmic chaperone PpiD n=1 Tax=Maribacter algarum (ex Zhang et al. 2020) TaxID=2578118 RepID=A0A5S3PWV4_9FLAO|nr:peptidylprolyl isomerase [Maribacter algarum]TMM59475.1 peptidylprolyl isomerase [Maribacter algarum]